MYNQLQQLCVCVSCLFMSIRLCVCVLVCAWMCVHTSTKDPRIPVLEFHVELRVLAYMDRFEAAARCAYICFGSAGDILIIVKRL